MTQMVLDDGFPIDRIREETPGTLKCAHFNNAGCSFSPEPVISAVTKYLREEAEIGGYELEARETAALAAVYDDVAKLVGAHADEIALLSSATAAWQQVFYALDLKPGDRVLVSQAEYSSNYIALLQREQRDGIVIEVIPSTTAGDLDFNALETMIDERVALIAVTWIPSNCGLVNPAAEIGTIANAHNIPYLLDACQAVGQIPVNVNVLGCDFLSATGRKFLRAPRGTGFLYVRRSWLEKLEPVMLDHQSAVLSGTESYAVWAKGQRFESFERSNALQLGLGVAVRYAMDIGLEAIQSRAFGLADLLRQELSKVPSVCLQDTGSETCAIVSFTVEGFDPMDMALLLRERGMNLSVSAPESTPVDAQSRKLPSFLRASPHYYNTETEIYGLAAEIAELATSLKPREL